MTNLPAKTKVETIRDLMNKAKPQIEMALPEHMNPNRMLRIAMTSIQQTPKLLECEPKSLVAAVIESSQLGLEPDGILGYAYLIPYGKKAQLQIGYRGLIDLAFRSGRVTKIYAQVVHAKDEYEVTFGLNPILKHIPTSDEDEGEIIASYAVVHFKTGEPDFEWMWKKDVDKIRAKAKAAKDGPWVTHYTEMAKKTAIRRLAKRIPLSPEFQRAAVLDEYVSQGIAESNGLIINVDSETVESLNKVLTNGKPEKEVKTEEAPLQYDCPDLLDENGKTTPVLAVQCKGCDNREGCPAHE